MALKFSRLLLAPFIGIDSATNVIGVLVAEVGCLKGPGDVTAPNVVFVVLEGVNVRVFGFSRLGGLFGRDFPGLALAESTGAPGDACDQEVGSGSPLCGASAVGVSHFPLRESPCPPCITPIVPEGGMTFVAPTVPGGKVVGVPVLVGAGSPGPPLLVCPGLYPPHS